MNYPNIIELIKIRYMNDWIMSLEQPYELLTVIAIYILPPFLLYIIFLILTED